MKVVAAFVTRLRAMGRSRVPLGVAIDPAPHFERLGVLGSGGMGQVLLARKTGPGGFSRLVALKSVLPGRAHEGEAARGLLIEARVAALVRHACVVPVEELVREGGEWLLVSPYIEGLTLAELRGAGAPPEVLRAIFVDLLAGLAAVHEAVAADGSPLGLVHCDVSPENVLVGADGTTRLLDFGIAQSRSLARTMPTSKLRGRLAYMSPERLNGQTTDARGDLFSVGVLLWEYFVGGLPFGRRESSAAEEKEERGAGEAVSAQLACLRRGLPAAGDVAPGLVELVERATRFDIEARIPSAAELSHALHAMGPVASRKEVSDWIGKRAGARLDAMRALAETTPPSGLAAVTKTARIETAPRRMRWRGLAGGVGLGTAFLLVWYALGDRSVSPPADVGGWLAARKAGYCASSGREVVALCVSDSPEFTDPNGEGNFCFDDRRTGRERLRRTYPAGLTVDLGVHIGTSTRGHLLTLGSTASLSPACDSNAPGQRLRIGIDDSGRLFAEGPDAPRLLGPSVEAGAHLIEYRVSARANQLYLDGHLVGDGSGTGRAVVEFPERWSPGFVLGASNQRWWACPDTGPEASSKMAAFFVHLRDRAEDRPFALAEAIASGPSTILLFDERGARQGWWYPSSRISGIEVHPELEVPTDAWFGGRVYGASWVTEVSSQCPGLNP